MLRTISHRLLAQSAPRAAFRPLSSSSVRYIKIKHADGTKTSPPSPSDSQYQSPSPAERPSSPPKETATTPPPLSEPVINTASPSTPPPTTSAGSTAPVEETVVEEIKDFSKLPSLDVDSEMARLAEPAPESNKPKDGQQTTGARRRTGAGRKEYVSSIEKQRKAMLRYSIGALVIGGLAVTFFGAGEGEAVKEGEPQVGTFERVKNNVNEFLDVSVLPLISSPETPIYPTLWAIYVSDFRLLRHSEVLTIVL